MLDKILCSRRWLAAIAEDANARIGLNDAALVAAASRDALRLLNMAPWHFRILVGGVETIASLWCVVDWLLHAARADAAREMSGFAKIPVISAPLLRLYRSLVFSSWFEQPAVLAAFGAESAEARQARFRQLRQSA